MCGKDPSVDPPDGTCTIPARPDCQLHDTCGTSPAAGLSRCAEPLLASMLVQTPSPHSLRLAALAQRCWRLRRSGRSGQGAQKTRGRRLPLRAQAKRRKPSGSRMYSNHQSTEMSCMRKLERPAPLGARELRDIKFAPPSLAASAPTRRGGTHITPNRRDARTPARLRNPGRQGSIRGEEIDRFLWARDGASRGASEEAGSVYSCHTSTYSCGWVAAQRTLPSSVWMQAT